MKSTAKANTNIALIKYWGKRNEKLFLPYNSSISITLDQFHTTTTVKYEENLKNDVFIFGGQTASEKEQIKISGFMDKVRQATGVHQYARITSINHVPTAAGFASSASGYAALTGAAVKAAGIMMTNQELSRLARQGSGSACRSIDGGFVKWEKGSREDGIDSFGHQIISELDWKVTVLSVMVDAKEKSVSSREGMRRTVETSPFYSSWLSSIEEDLERATIAIQGKDFQALGEVVEENALKMHATMMGAKPPIIYWTAGTMAVIQCVQEMRTKGIPAYFTIDAGANVKVLCMPETEIVVKDTLLTLEGVKSIISCYPGQGLQYESNATIGIC